MENVGIFYVHLKYFTVIWYMLVSFGNFGIFFHVLVYCTKKNVAASLLSPFQMKRAKRAIVYSSQVVL
jgi:hypothetical protein